MNSRVLSRHFLAVIVRRERERERLGLARLHAGERRLEFRQHAAFAQRDREVLRLSARELDAVDGAGEVDHARGRPLCAPPRSARTSRAGGAARRRVRSMSSSVTSTCGRSMVDAEMSPTCTSGIDLEHRRELERALRRRRAVRRLDARIARDAQVLLADGVVEARLHGVGDDVRAHLRAILLRHHLDGHVARTKPGTLTVLARRASRLSISPSICCSGTATCKRRASWPKVSNVLCMLLSLRLPGMRSWCERGDSNPHGLPRQLLRLVRLPIPPLSRQAEFGSRSRSPKAASAERVSIAGIARCCTASMAARRRCVRL